MQSYKDLDIYKLSHRLAIEIHKMTLNKLPKFEMYEEGAQIRRSSKSIVCNIVEGFGRRRYKQEFIQYLIYSQASCDETREHIDLLFDTESFIDKNLYDHLKGKYEELGAKIANFIRSVERGHLTRRK
jgi:four helix bundle protein